MRARRRDRGAGHERADPGLRSGFSFRTAQGSLAAWQSGMGCLDAVLLEYEEVVRRSSGQKRWKDVWSFLTLIDLLHGSIHRIGPRYRFHTITGDADDDAFADCAIAVGADWIITSDHHFDALIGSGYQPQPIPPTEFIRRHLAAD